MAPSDAEKDIIILREKGERLAAARRNFPYPRRQVLFGAEKHDFGRIFSAPAAAEGAGKRTELTSTA